MSEVLLYPRILYLAQPAAATGLAGLASRKLLPASSVLTSVDIDQTTVADLIHTIETADLDSAALQLTYFEVDVLKTLDQYEWVIADRPYAKLLAAPIQGYVYVEDSVNAALHCVQFVGSAITIPYSSINSVLMHRLSRAHNLTELPAAAASLINAHRPGSLRRTRERAAKVSVLVPPGKTLGPAVQTVTETVIRLPFEIYVASVLELVRFVTTNLTLLYENFSSPADIAFTGQWFDGQLAVIQAYKLTGNQAHGGWLVIGAVQGRDS